MVNLDSEVDLPSDSSVRDDKSICIENIVNRLTYEIVTHFARTLFRCR